MPGRHSKRPFDTHYHVSLAGEIGQRVGGGRGHGAGRIRWIAPHNLVFFLSRHSLLLQLDPENLPDTLKRRGVTQESTGEMGAGRRAVWHAATNEHQVETRWEGQERGREDPRMVVGPAAPPSRRHIKHLLNMS